MRGCGKAVSEDSVDIERFCRTRPRLYHLTSAANRLRIAREGVILPAAQVLEAAGLGSWIRRRRSEMLTVQVDGEPVDLRDQRPLHRGNIELEGGWRFDDVLASLNSHVFFWPGSTDLPIPYGGRHFGRYRGEGCQVLVVNTRDLLEANRELSPSFCRYNSGSPRCAGGRGSPRGPSTFLPAHDFVGTPSTVVEVVFGGPVRLPVSVGWIAADTLAI